MTLTMAEVKKIEDNTGLKAGECQRCHKVVDKHSFWCRKHTKRNWAERRLKISDPAEIERLEAIRSKRQRTKAMNALVKKEGLDLTSHSLPANTPTFHDNYKEPLRTVDGGYGYMGVVATDETRDFIQCHVCGKLFESLNGHSSEHDLTIREYKEKYGLAQGTALIGERLRNTRIKAMEMGKAAGLLEGFEAASERMKQYNQEHNPAKNRRKDINRYPLELQNKRGLCPDQVLEKLTDYIKELGRVPTQEEFQRHYKYKYIHSATRFFGNWHGYVEAAGHTSVVKAREEATRPEQLIKYLQDFYDKNGRVPMNSDFKRGIVVSRYNYFKHFGTLNNARIEAGLPAVIPMPGHRYYLVKPEQYEDYQKLKDQVATKRERTKNHKDIYAQFESIDYAELYGEVLV